MDKDKQVAKIEGEVMSEQEFKDEKTRGRGNVFIGTLNVAMRPAQAITGQVRRAYHSKYAGKYKRAKVLFYVDMVLLGIIAALAITIGFLYFFKPSVADKIKVDEVVSVAEVVSGKEVTFTWTYRNESEVILEDVYWSINAPTNFEVISTVPQRSDPTKNVISLGVLPPNAEGRIKLHGRVWGTIGDPHTIWSSMSFTQAENKKKEQKAITTSYVIADSVLDVQLLAPERLVNNQEVELEFTYKNTSAEKLDNVEIHAYWPAGFEYTASEKPFKDNVWAIGDLQPGEEGAFEARGILSSPDSQARFYFETYLNVDDREIRQEILASAAEILPPQIEVATYINGSAEPSLAWGGVADVTIKFTNISDYNINDVSLALEVDPYAINTARISGLEYSEGKLYFPDRIQTMAAGETKELSTKLYLKISPDLSHFGEAKNITLPFAVEAHYKMQGEDQDIVYRSGQTSAKMQTPLYAEVFARYWSKEGDQLGRGPLPPRVDRSTKYWVFWNLGQTTNQLSNIYVQLKLAPNVGYTGMSSVTLGDKINYDAETRLVTWFLKDLEPTTVSGATAAISLEVEIVPTPAQAGTAAPLIEWAKVMATDEFISKEISTTSGAVTTDLSYDARASGLGIVKY